MVFCTTGNGLVFLIQEVCANPMRVWNARGFYRFVLLEKRFALILHKNLIFGRFWQEKVNGVVNEMGSLITFESSEKDNQISVTGKWSGKFGCKAPVQKEIGVDLNQKMLEYVKRTIFFLQIVCPPILKIALIVFCAEMQKMKTGPCKSWFATKHKCQIYW